MANPNANKTVSTTSKLTPAEEEEVALQKALEDEAAAIAAAQEALSLAQSSTPSLAVSAARPVSRPVGDVRVRVLKNETRVSLGGRRYTFKKDEEILMDPSHATEMAGSGWVTILERG
jgi:hypothetical protein